MTLRLKTILAFVVGAALLSVTCCDVFSQTNGLPRDVRAVLENADSFTLFSTNPEPDFFHKSKNTFLGHAILGQLKIQSKTTRKELIDDLNEDIARVQKEASRGVFIATADCFDPRHGIRAKKGDETVELLICFECGGMYINSPWARNQFFVITREPAATFNEVLKHAGIPLPKN